MKHFVLFALLLFIVKLCGAQVLRTTFYINGKEFHSKDSISRSDLKEICSLEINDAKTNVRDKPFSFQITFSDRGQIFKIQCSPRSIKQIESIAERLKNGGVIFIDEVKFKTPNGFKGEQLVLLVK
jgi:hypothetical protein